LKRTEYLKAEKEIKYSIKTKKGRKKETANKCNE
jgi:hypothetical protein